MRSVPRKALPRHSVDVDSLLISYADIFISLVRAAGGSPPQSELTVDDVLFGATILHTTDMTQPSQSGLSKQTVYWEDHHETGRQRWLLCLARTFPEIRRMLLMWNVLSIVSYPAHAIHVSLSYSNMLVIQVLQTVIFSSPTAWSLSTLEP